MFYSLTNSLTCILTAVSAYTPTDTSAACSAHTPVPPLQLPTPHPLSTLARLPTFQMQSSTSKPLKCKQKHFFSFHRFRCRHLSGLPLQLNTFQSLSVLELPANLPFNSTPTLELMRLLLLLSVLPF